MRKSFQHSRVQLKDRQRIILYFKNKRWSTGYKLSKPIPKGKTSVEWSESTSKLTSQWKLGDAEIANKTIYEKKNEIDNLIDEARSKNYDIIPYVESVINKKNATLLNLLVTKKTKPYIALEEFIKRKTALKFYKNEKSMVDRHKGYITNVKDFYDLKNKSSLGSINDKWIRELCEFVTTKRSKTNEVYREYDNVTYKTNIEVQLTNATLKRLLSEINQMLKSLNSEHIDFNFNTEGITELIKNLPTRSKDKTHNDEDAYDTMTMKQWEALKKYKLPKNRRKNHQLSLDLFIFSVNTGLRFIDSNQLCDDYVTKDNIIKMKAEKNKTKTVRGDFSVPMNDKALELYEKYNRDFRGKFPNNQTVNKTLKKIFKEIEEFKTLKTKYKYILMTPIEQKVHTWETLTFHSSRRQFVNLLVQSGANISQIQELTGWQDIRTIIAYMDSSLYDPNEMRSKLNSF